MPLRRYPAPDAAVFLTQVAAQRQRLFLLPENLELLLFTLREAKKRYPYEMLAYVFLPDHFHLLIRPQDPVTFSKVMFSVKTNFSRLYRSAHALPAPVQIWQKSFWDHVIRDQEDLNRHVDYVHYNPVRHGWCERPEEWPHSSFGEWKAQGFYADMWGWSLPDWLEATASHAAVMDVE